MAAPTTYTRTIAPDNAPLPGRSAAAAGAGQALLGEAAVGEGAALSNLGQAGLNAYNAVRRREDENAMQSAHLAAIRARGEMQDYLQQTHDAVQGDPTGTTGRFMQGYDDYKTKALANTPNEKARLYLEAHLETLGYDLQFKSIHWETAQKAAFDKVSLGEAGMIAGRTLQNDPTQYDAVMRDHEAYIDSLRITPAQKAEQKAASRTHLASQTTAGQLSRDPWSIQRLANQALGVPEIAGANPPPPPPNAAQPLAITTTVDGKPVGGPLLDAVIRAESNGKDYAANGQPLTSPVGAKYAMQVMPATAKNPGYGITPAASDTPEEYNRVGREYLGAMLKEFGGNQAQALAAYNAGPGAVQKAMAKWGDAWLEHMPAETRAYVAKITAETGPTRVAAADTGTASDAQTYPYRDPATPYQDVPVPNGGKTGVQWFDDLKPEDVVRFKHAADEAVKHQMTGLRSDLERRGKDAEAMAATGRRDPRPITPDEFRAAWGPAEGTRRAIEYQATQDMADVVNTFNGRSYDEINAAVAGLTPQDGPGFAEGMHRQSIALRAANAVLKAREDDAGAWVRNNSAPVRDAFNAFVRASQDEGVDQPTRTLLAQRYVQQSLAEQQRLGIANVAPVPKEYVERLVSAFSVTKDGGSNAAQVMQREAATWGAAWPDVFAQAGKKLPPEAQVIGSLGRDANPITVALVAQTAGMKVEKMTEGMDPGDVKDLKAKMVTTFAPLQKTLAWQPGGIQTFDTLYGAAEKVSLVYMQRGAKATDAATKAFAELVGNNYEFKDFARIPKKYDADAVMRGASQIKSTLAAYDLALPPAPPGMKEEDVRAQYVSALQRGGVWLTAADESGLILYDPVTQSAVRDRQGRFVQQTFQRLVNQGGSSLWQSLTGAVPAGSGRAVTGSIARPGMPTQPPAFVAEPSRGAPTALTDNTW